MSIALRNPPRPLPVWLTGPGSLFAAAHLLALGLLALAPQSGPWSTPFGIHMADGPHFATWITSDFTYPYYLQHLRLTHNYHFDSNKPVFIGISFEVTLKDENGEPIRTVKFPDDKANVWMRHRQSILAQGLGNDQPLAPRGSDPIAPKGGVLPTVEYWDPVDKDTLRLKKVDILELKHDRQYEKPSEGAKVLAQAYLRYLCRAHNAASAELVRRHRRAIYPMALLMPNGPPADDFIETKSLFGDYRREE